MGALCARYGPLVILEQGFRGKITTAYDLSEGAPEYNPSWILEVQIELPEQACHFTPEIGVSLSGRRLFPASELGKSTLVL